VAERKARAGSPLSTTVNLDLDMLKLNKLGILRGPVGCQRTTFQRSFALSRFPDRGAPSGGRTRPRSPAPRIRLAQAGRPDTSGRPTLTQDETTFDTSNSSLWEESQRPPSSDPEDGLKRLLQNETLVVTRSVTYPASHFVNCNCISFDTDSSKCSIYSWALSKRINMSSVGIASFILFPS
jgi:hypothetical protein